MKIVPDYGLTAFSGNALLFEPASSASRIGFNRMTQVISYVAPTKEYCFSVIDHFTEPSAPGVLHAESLECLYTAHSEYFGTAYKKAKVARLNTYNTFLYESPKSTDLFLATSEEFRCALEAGRIPAAMYEMLYSITGYAEYLKNYLSRMTTRETLPSLVEFCNSLTGQGLKKFLSDHLEKQYKLWAIQPA